MGGGGGGYEASRRVVKGNSQGFNPIMQKKDLKIFLTNYFFKINSRGRLYSRYLVLDDQSSKVIRKIKIVNKLIYMDELLACVSTNNNHKLNVYVDSMSYYVCPSPFLAPPAHFWISLKKEDLKTCLGFHNL